MKKGKIEQEIKRKHCEQEVSEVEELMELEKELARVQQLQKDQKSRQKSE